MPAQPKVLIIGATSAVATEVARRYADRDASLFLIARSQERLDHLVEELGDRVAGSSRADLTETSAAAARVEEAVEVLGGLDIAVIAHGLLGDQLETERSWSHAQEVIDTNFSSVVALLVPIANQLEARGWGHIAVLSSVAGERGRPRNYTYGAAKGALTHYLEGLRSRLWGRVSVHTIKLGPVDSPMTADHPKNALFTTPDRAAAQIVRAIDGRGGDVFVPWFWRPIMGVVRHLPEPLFQRLPFLSGR